MKIKNKKLFAGFIVLCIFLVFVFPYLAVEIFNNWEWLQEKNDRKMFFTIQTFLITLSGLVWWAFGIEWEVKK